MTAKKYANDEERLAAKRKRDRAYREKNKEEIGVRNREWAINNKERRLGHNRSWRARNTDVSLRKHGLTRDSFDVMLAKHDGGCWICGAKPPEGQRLCVDHCHKTGKIRGLLCHSCNKGLGLMRDNPKVLESAAKYLKENGHV